MAATAKLTGTYEGPATRDLNRGEEIQIVGFEHDRSGRECAWIVARERIHCIYAEYVRVK